MAKKKFANLDDTFKEVAEASAKKANVYTLINIANADLIDYAKNQEDIENTSDIENSINEVGFIDPIEVTDYGQSEGKFMIISGHRRRAAGVKCGIEYFPCISRHFESDEEVYNYVLLSNNHRDSSKDPLLYCKRYKMHEEYLNQINFKGNYRTEIAKRLGISKPQADRYNAMNKIILPVWDMVRDEIVSISGVFPLASHTAKEQDEIVIMMNEYLDNNSILSREAIKIIVEAYRNGKRAYSEVISDMSVNVLDEDGKEIGDDLINDNQKEYKKSAEKNTNNKLNEKNTSLSSVNDNAEEITEKGNKNLNKVGQEIIASLENINNCFKNNTFNSDKKDAELIINSFSETLKIVIHEMQGISKENNLDDAYDKFLKNIVLTVSTYQV